MTIITTNDELKQLCHNLNSKSYITIDTEFLRQYTYYPKLCLLQIADDKDAFAIDCLSKDIDLTPLFPILANKKILKIFHACRQDIEILHGLTGKIPEPIFDTQVAASVCGFGESVGYENLSAKLLNINIDKSSRFTDWSRRPLTAKQLDYALGDVIHLREIYFKLLAMLEKKGRASWIKEEMEQLLKISNYEIDPNTSWLKIKLKVKNHKFVNMVKELAYWREIKAQKLDLPRNHFLKEEALLEMAANPPKNLEELSKIRQISKKVLASTQSNDLLKFIQKVKEAPCNGKELLKSRLDEKNIPNNALLHMLKLLLKITSEQHQVAEKIIASSRDIAKISIASDDQLTDIAAMNGWRYEIFGKYAKGLRDGSLALKLDGEKIELVPVGK